MTKIQTKIYYFNEKKTKILRYRNLEKEVLVDLIRNDDEWPTDQVSGSVKWWGGTQADEGETADEYACAYTPLGALRSNSR